MYSSLVRIIVPITNDSASVVTARLTPRTRSAGSDTTTPTGTASRMPMATAIGNGRPQTSPASRPANSAPIPASDHWARLSCPAYPISTTSESATSAKIALVMTAFAQSSPKSNTESIAAAPAPTTTTGFVTEPIEGRRSARKLRSGRGLPRTTRMATITRKGTAVWSPLVTPVGSA